jgi:hypothetical protein
MFRLPAILLAVSLTGWATGADRQAPAKDKGKGPLVLAEGPHLFLDDHLIAHSAGVERRVVPPRRFLNDPVVTSAPEHQNWQPWLTVLRDPASKRFRMWYTADVVDDPADQAYATKLAYLESTDGIKWPGPYKRHNEVDPILFGASVLDDGPRHPRPAERFKIVYFGIDHAAKVKSGPRVAFSPDGLRWTRQNAGEPVLDVGQGNDSWHAGFDPIRQRYFMILKLYGPHTWTNAEGKKVTKAIRRFAVSFSKDFKDWTAPRMIFSPDARDPGITEWYGAVGFQVRGDLILAFLQVLRDDLTAEGAPKEAVAANQGNAGAGVGYTVLAWTRDGETWHRDRHTDRFFEPDPKVGAWDHAVSWVSSSVIVGDEVYLYDAGYRWGHKYRRSVDRQVGLVKTTRDRYVARRAGAAGGTLRTPLVTLKGRQLTLNVDASKGEVRVQIVDADGKAIPGFAFADCRPVTEDALAAGVQWRKPLAELGGRAVRLEFALKNASLFALDLKK